MDDPPKIVDEPIDAYGAREQLRCSVVILVACIKVGQCFQALNVIGVLRKPVLVDFLRIGWSFHRHINLREIPPCARLIGVFIEDAAEELFRRRQILLRDPHESQQLLIVDVIGIPLDESLRRCRRLVSALSTQGSKDQWRTGQHTSGIGLEHVRQFRKAPTGIAG